MRQLKDTKPTPQIPYSEYGIQDFIEKELKQYQGKSYYCKALGVNVSVTRKSVEETSYNCRFNRKAAELALQLPYIIGHAKIEKLRLPTKSIRQTKYFRFTEIATLTCNVRKKGIARLVVGFRDNGEVVEYSVTNCQTNKTSQFID